jgi:hypothetical protein
MIIGQTLHAINGSDATTTYYSPWFSRAGNLLGVAVDIIATEDLDKLSIGIETKKAEDADPAYTTSTGTNLVKYEEISSVTVGIHKFRAGANLDTAGGLLDLVRYRFDLGVTSSETDGWIHFRMLNPAWLTN